ncbi:MAG: TolC family protein [Dysosmobacter sp.]|uniref:TolC family protein n=1 Tax=Dysosmobacter sp. TaxID=2591382 RepID=UPI00283B33FA|nr:TolC family protein [Dysosmobacter sp.]MDR3983711.1 TolC family protein [Dysosmobacter sp.]
MMRKRILAFVLAAALIGSLLVTAAVAEEDGAPAETAQSGESAPTENESGETAAVTDGESTAGETQEPQQDAQTEIPAPDPVGQLSFANLENRMRENNLTILMLEESIASINEIDFDKQIDDLRDMLNEISAGITAMRLANNSQAADALQADYDSMKAQFDQLYEGDVRDDYDAAVRQLRNTEDQMIKTAETIYINILELQNTDAQLQRSLAAMNRTVQEMELRYDLGQISALQLQQTESGRTQLKSSLETVEMNLDNLIVQMEVMIGAEQTGALKLGEIPDVTDEQIAAMDLEKDLAAAKEVSYALFDAQKTLNDAKETYEDAIDGKGINSYQRKSAEHTWKAAQYTYEAAVQSFELSFRTAFNAVADQQQILKASQTALALQQDTYASMELKYQQGSISKNALQDAKDDLDDAQTAVDTARHNLFTAYRTYRWAVDKGLLNT